VDRGLISENPRGLSVKSAKSGPRVDFTKVKGPAGAQNEEGGTGSSARASPELGRRCGSRAMVVQNREATALGEDTAQACREGKDAGRGVVLLGGGARLL
jgi:hypothetical protein